MGKRKLDQLKNQSQYKQSSASCTGPKVYDDSHIGKVYFRIKGIMTEGEKA